RIGGSVVGLDAATGKHEVARGEPALVVALDQQSFDAAVLTVAQQHERRRRRRDSRRRFDGHPGSVTRCTRSVIASRRNSMGAEARLKEKNITLPVPNTPMANYVGAVRTGNLLFVSGHGPLRADGKPSARGKVGRELSTEQGYQVAREVGINLLATTRASLGSLDRSKL